MRNLWVVFAASLVLAPQLLRAENKAPARGTTAQLQFVKILDPCSVATEKDLKPLIATALNSAFPIMKEQPGKKMTIKNPDLRSVTCSNPLRIEVRADISYRDTRGLDQGSASGQLRFGANVVGRVSYTGQFGGPITAANFKGAKACMKDFSVLGLNLNNVPNWIDNTVIRDALNDKLGNMERCIDISSYVRLYLQNGGTL